MFHKAAIGIAPVAADGRWIQVNEALRRMLGYSMEELRRCTFQDITFAGDLEADLALVLQLVAGEIERYQIEKRYIRKDGRVIWANLSVTIEREAGGGHHFISVVEDIQARKEAENSLRALRVELEQKVETRTEALRDEALGRRLDETLIPSALRLALEGQHFLRR